MTGGMMDIGSMSMEDMPQSSGKNVRQKKPAVQGFDLRLLIAAGVAAVVVIVVAAVAIAGAIGRGKAKNAVMKLSEILSLNANADLDDVLDFYEECYPKELYDVVEKEVRSAYNASLNMEYDWDDNEDIVLSKIISVTPIKDSESMDIFQDDVKALFNKYDVKIKTKDIDISGAYLILCRMELYGESDVIPILVLKVNGKYGVYGIGELSVSIF